MFASKDTLLTRPSGYNIARSVRLRSSASAYLSRTPATTSNRKTWTWSGWVKRGKLSSSQDVFGTVYTSGGTNDQTYIRLESNDKIGFVIYDTAGGYSAIFATTSVYRDPSAWYHIILALDTTQATSTDRVKLYVNGIQVTSFSSSTYPAQNKDAYVNLSGREIGIGNTQPSGASYFDGYLTEINFIDGQALTPSSFGTTNAITGVWQPTKYTGTYGTNGFYLNFSDNSSNTATTIGKDYSGNGNNWTPNNISVTAGVTYDSMLDSPTVSAVSSNYAVLNPITGSATLSNGNLAYTSPSGAYYATIGTIGVSSGKWYWEFTANGAGQDVGICAITNRGQQGVYVGSTSDSYGYYGGSGNKYNNGSASAYGATYTTNDVIGVALDMDAGTLVFYKNNTSQGTAYSSLSGTFLPMASNDSTNAGAGTFNFGQRPFSYTPPTGYVALNTYNLPASTITNGAAYMAASLYTGTNANLTVTNTVNGTGMQPDLVWMKIRSTTASHVLIDSVRGVTKTLNSDLTNAESTSSGTSGLLSFNSNGFSLGTDSTATGSTNGSGNTYVGWQWKAGGTSSSNTSGSITSTVSVGATQGFSVVTFTAQTSGTATVGHGLGVAPSMIITKVRNGTSNWASYHTSLGNTQYIELNTTTAAQTLSTAWNNTSPTSTVFTLGSAFAAASQTMVAYCFAAVAGFSAFGSYTGNGSADGPFVYTGFRPRFVMVKNANDTGYWVILDSTRDAYNVASAQLFPNVSNAEASNATFDFLSNGFKIRQSGTTINPATGVNIYAAFAESPFKTSLAR